MTRVTPRTCLWPMTISLLVTFGLSIGLTFRSNHHCYAGTCGEWLFPLQARLHIAVWYCWISITVAFLAVRAFSSELRLVLRRPLLDRKIPAVAKHLTVSGALAVIWIIALYSIVIGIWWVRLRDYFMKRGRDGGVLEGNQRLAAIALTGHMCDVTMGMALIPISRHSALGSFFKLSASTTLAFHMLTAYTLFVLVLIHGFIYVAWIPMFTSLPAQLRKIYPVLNPTYLYYETWPGNSNPLGIWRSSLIFTGIATALTMLVIFVTTLPPLRQKHFNLFYFTHLFAIVAVVVICLHASTMFYCTAPGTAMWVLDWGMRLYELREKLDGNIVTLGNGWYCLTLSLPRGRLDGCACTSPLAHFYIHHSGSSIRELHPFTTITHLATANSISPKSAHDFPIQFLFRKQATSLRPEATPKVNGSWVAPRILARLQRPKVQWTEKVAGLVDKEIPRPSEEADPVGSARLWPVASTSSRRSSLNPIACLGNSHAMANVSLRLEGPYFTPADPTRYHTVVCLVAGTGVSGAIAIACAFTNIARETAEACDIGARHTACTSCDRSIMRWKRCVIVWSVREEDYVEVPFLHSKESSHSALEVRIHLTAKDRPRIDLYKTLSSIRSIDLEGDMWVYLSGPNRFIEAGENACKNVAGVDWYAARWDI